MYIEDREMQENFSQNCAETAVRSNKSKVVAAPNQQKKLTAHQICGSLLIGVLTGY